jgi:phage terminase large subunit
MDDNKIVKLLEEYQSSPFRFFEDAYGLTPQKPKQHAQKRMQFLFLCPASMFNDLASTFALDDFEEFEKGKEITWQQTILLIAIQRAYTEKDFPKKIAVKSGRGTGKAVALGTLIPKIVDGNIIFTEARDIKIGDTILGKDKPTNVTGIFMQDENQLYTVSFDDDSSVIVNGDHLWNVCDKKSIKHTGKRDAENEFERWETLSTNEILSRGIVAGGNREKRFRIPIQRVKGTSSVKDAYIAGVWYGDGTCLQEHYSHFIKYTKPDKFIVDKIRGLGYKVTETDKSSKTIFGYYDVAKNIGYKFDKKGLPNNFLSWDIESRVELLRGLCDTDGTIDRNGVVEFSSSIRELAEDVELLLRSLGGKTRIRTKKNVFYTVNGGERIKAKDNYRLTVSVDFNPFSLPRKADRWKAQTQKRYQTRFIKSIEKHSIDKSVCFTVDAEDRLFLAGKELIVTHNSFSVSSLFPWHLYSFKDSRAMCTAPTADQMEGAILAELARNLNNMDDVFKKMFSLSADKLSRNDNPKDIWARFRTASKEKPEALSGVHSKWLLAVADEASAIIDEILNNADDTLTDQTGANVMVLITNPTRTSGYFFNIFYDKDNKPNKDSDKYWIKLTFNSLESPLFSKKKAEESLLKYGSVTHPEYMASILGEFPMVDMVDKEGWYRMFDNDTIDKAFLPEDTKYSDTELIGGIRLGADPSGAGEDDATIIVRSSRIAKLEHSEKVSNEHKMSENIGKIVSKHNIVDGDTFYDNFNIGANIGKILYSLYNIDAVGVNVGLPCVGDEDNKKYLNIRCMIYDRMLNWFRIGGKVVYNEKLKKELQSIYCRRTERGQLQIMPKRDMRKRGLKSPNIADSLALTFTEDDPTNPYVTSGDRVDTVYYNKTGISV